MQVLDDRGFVGLRVIEFEHTSRDRRASRELRGSQAARDGHERDTLSVGADEDWLEHVVTTHAQSEFFEARLGERPSRVGRRFVDGVDCELSEFTHGYTSG